MDHDVFISYSDEDILTAEAVCAGLESRGLRCWYAARDILKGENPARARERAIAGAGLMVLIFSDYSNDSQLILREVCSAADGRKPIVPYRVCRQEPSGSLRYFLGGTHWLDAADVDSRKAISKLADECVSKLRRTPEKVNKKWILIAVLVLVVAAAAAALLVSRGGGAEPAEDVQETETTEQNESKSPAKNLVFSARDMTCGEFVSKYEAELAALGYDPGPFVLEVLDESGAPGDDGSKVVSVRLSLDEGKAAGVSKEETQAHIAALIRTAFTGNEGDADRYAERLMKPYDTTELAVNDAVDGMSLYCKFTEKGGRLTIEPL